MTKILIMIPFNQHFARPVNLTFFGGEGVVEVINISNVHACSLPIEVLVQAKGCTSTSALLMEILKILLSK